MATKKIKIVISSTEEFFRSAKKFASELDNGIVKKQQPSISFENFETYNRILTPKRLELLKAINLGKPKNIKELAVFINRDFKNVYQDLKMLENVGLIKLKKSKLGLAPVVIYDEIDINIKIPLEPLSST